MNTDSIVEGRSGMPFHLRVGLLLMLAMPLDVMAEEADRLTPSGLNSAFVEGVDGFPDYVARMREIIDQARVYPPDGDRNGILDGNAPFILEPGKECGPPESPGRKGVLLVHGLTDSPYLMGYLARHLQQRCFLVQVLLLPGHGTRPGDLLEVTWREWARAFSFGVNTLRPRVDELYLGGFSTGAALAIQHAMQHEEISGLLLFSPAVAVTPLARLSCAMASLSGIIPPLAWVGGTQPDEDTFKYESFAANAGCQIFRLTREIKDVRGGEPLGIPVFVAASADDSTVRVDATLEMFSAATSPDKRMLLFTRGHADVPQGVRSIDSRVPEKDIASSAHTAMMMPASDPHYGENGDYALCSIYYRKKPEAYDRCKARDEDILGETVDDLLEQGVVRRLTYNPHYELMMEELDAFLDRVGNL